jgi:pyrimidine-nucleoside phosphorylase
MQNADIGYALTDLGGGRKTKNVPIDLGVGFIFHKKIGDAVKKDEALLSIYHHDHQRDFVESLSKKFQNEIIEIKATKVKKSKLIYKIIK